MNDRSMQALWHHHGPGLHTGLSGAPLVIAAIGVVFGDIGTSPIYTFSTVLSVIGSTAHDTVMGVTSMIFWSITLIVSILYVRLLMRHDNDGEGGLLALLGLLRRSGPSARVITATTAIAVVGAALFFGDSIITPAISVLSAVEGLSIVAPELEVLVLPIAVAVLIVLFLAQRFGTKTIGRAFGPVMVAWFFTLILISVPEILAHPVILTALSPHWIVLLTLAHPWTAFAALTGVVLAVTGAEALFADMGHFGRSSITIAWFSLVYPALTLNYLAQAARVLSDQSATAPFFALVPRWGLIPVVILATLATVIASQAVISGAFSVAQQAGRLRLLPPLRVVRVSAESRGQVYLPAVNTLLGAAVVVAAIAFGSSQALASAYGIAVTITILTTTLLLLVLLGSGRGSGRDPGRGQASGRDRAPVQMLLTVIALVLICVIAASNVTKIAAGGWFPFGVGIVLSLLMFSWNSGQLRLQDSRRAARRPLSELVSALDSAAGPRRVPGVAVYLTHLPGSIPSGLQLMLGHGHVLHETIVLVSVTTSTLPFERHDEWSYHRGGLISLRIRLGYRMMSRVPDLLASSALLGDEHAARPLTLHDVDTALFVASQVLPFAAAHHGMPAWQRFIFTTLIRLHPDPHDIFGLPRQRSLLLVSELPV